MQEIITEKLDIFIERLVLVIVMYIENIWKMSNLKRFLSGLWRIKRSKKQL